MSDADDDDLAEEITKLNHAVNNNYFKHKETLKMPTNDQDTDQNMKDPGDLTGKRGRDNSTVADGGASSKAPAIAKYQAPGSSLQNASDRLLIPLDADEKGNVEYVSRAKYKTLGFDDSPKALDDKAVLIKTNAETFLTKNQIYKTTYIGPNVDKADRDTVRDTNFKARMEELGLSDKNFADVKPEKLVGAAKEFETPGGTRKIAFNYENPVQTGQFSPDVLIRTKEGRFIASWPKNEKEKTLEEAADKYGRENVMLKTAGNSYVAPETFNMRGGDMAAEKAYAKFAGTQLKLERPDMPKALYKVDEGIYVPKEQYAAFAESDRYKGKIPADKSQTEVLFQAPGGHALVDGKTLKFVDPKGYAQTFKDEGLPEDLKTRRNVTKPDAMVYIKDEAMLISSVRALSLSNGKTLDQVFPSSNIYVQNLGKTGIPTGNYADRDTFEKRVGPAKAYDRLAQAGITESPEAANIKRLYSPANLRDSIPPVQERDRQISNRDPNSPSNLQNNTRPAPVDNARTFADRTPYGRGL